LSWLSVPVAGLLVTVYMAVVTVGTIGALYYAKSRVTALTWPVEGSVTPLADTR
jgi:hypothetical protein